jgi:hypothetical protein
MEPAGGAAIGDRLVPQSEGDELTGGDDTVLPVGEHRNPPIHAGWADFHRSCLLFSAQPLHPSENAGSRRACGARAVPILRRLRYAAVASMFRRT